MAHACKDSRLSAYLDGELSAEETAQVERHLARCPACRARLRRLERLGSTLRGARPPAPLPDLWPRIRPRLAAAARGGRMRAVWRWAAACAVAGAAILALRVGIFPASAPAPARVADVRAAVDFRHNTVVTLVSWGACDQEPSR